MKSALVALTLLLAACSTPPSVYPTLQEQVLSLAKGDLEAGGIAFITPATVTGQEQEKQAVALTFADVLKRKRPELKVITLAETLSAVNRARLAETYNGLYEEYRETGLFPAEALGRIAGATGARYLAQLKLQGFTQSSKNRFGFLGLRIIDTQYADLRLYLQIWDGRDGAIAWEAMEELRVAVDSTTDEPVMLRKVLERSAQDLVAKLP